MRRLYPLLALLPLAQPAVAQSAGASPAHTILVRGTADKELEPEKLDLLLTYRFSDNVKESGRTQEQEKALGEVLRQAGIPAEKLVLEDLNASGYGGFSKVGNANVALTKVYRLTLEPPQLLDKLVPQLVQTGADNLRFVNLRNSQLAATKTELTGQAVADARQKAMVAAKASGSQLGSVLMMTEVLPAALGAQNAMRAYQARLSSNAYYDQARQESEAENLIPSLRKIKVQIVYDIVYEIK
jgi:uncharacterized protein YggE